MRDAELRCNVLRPAGEVAARFGLRVTMRLLDDGLILGRAPDASIVDCEQTVVAAQNAIESKRKTCGAADACA